MSETFFVAGATGYVGHAVARAARGAGLAVTAHVRPDSRRLEEWRSRFTALGADVDTTPWELAAMTASSVVIHSTEISAMPRSDRRCINRY